MRKKIFCFLIFFVFTTLSLLGQNNFSTGWPEVMPRTPEVAALERFADYPVGYSTGTVNINVPFFSFSLGKNVELPIGISYHCSGVKVADVSGRTGLGWALNAGGVISRDVRGQKDEMGYSGFYSFINKHNGYTFPDNIAPDEHASLLDSIYKGKIDSEPDLFTVILPTGSHKFFYGSDGEFHCIPAANIKISQTALNNREGFGSWTITDEYGNRYIFGKHLTQSAIEYTETSDTGRRCATAWKLLAIFSAENKLLATFSYKNKDYQRSNTYNIYKFYDNQVGSWGGNYSGTESLVGQKTRTFGYAFNGKNLTSINIPGVGSISFHTLQTWKNDCSLIDSITFNDERNGKNQGFCLSYEDSYRHFLETVTKYGTDIQSELYRKFEYYPDLPYDTDNKGQDIWGYSNGRRNQNMYPLEANLRHPNAIAHSDRYANRNAINGSLRTIYYLTGGKSVFYYENNDVYSAPNSGEAYNIESDIDFVRANTTNYIGTYFQPAIRERVKIDISFALHPAGLISTSFELVDSLDNIFFNSYDSDLAHYSTRRDGTTNEGYYMFDYSTEINLPPGKYRWRVSYELIIEVRPVKIHPATITTHYYKAVRIQNNFGKKLTGGIRIASIENYDETGSVVDTRKFTYTRPDGSSSGIEGPSPVFTRYYLEGINLIGTGYGATIQGPVFVGIEEAGEMNLCKYTGSAVQYTDVIEDRVTNGNILRTLYHYYQRSFEYPTIRSNTFKNSWKMMSFGDNSYEEGLLESKILYKEESRRFVELQRERYLYDIQKYSGDVYVQRCVSLENVVKNLTDQRMKASDKYYCGTYRLVSAKVFPVKTLTITYSGTDTLTYTETRTFANDIYLNPTSSRRYIDSSTPSATEYSYCYDATDAVSRKMKERNMLSMPLSVKTTYKGTEILVATKYGFFINGNDTLIEPASVTMTRTGEHDTYTYNSYDGFGNPLHITRNGLEHRYYLWSYHGHCPIAEIIGGDYTHEEVRSAVRAVFGKNAEDISMQELPDTVKLMNGSLQRKLPKAQVSTFTFDSYSGVTSVTAPNGITAKYLYDGFGRLERSLIPVLLSNGCISEVVRESYQYHYGNK